MKVERIGKWTRPDGLSEPGRIVAAAIMQDDEVWIGRRPLRHHDIIREIVEVTGVKPVTGEQGFWTEDGYWLRRAPALMIALGHGQVEEGKTANGRQLPHRRCLSR